LAAKIAWHIATKKGKQKTSAAGISAAVAVARGGRTRTPAMEAATGRAIVVVIICIGLNIVVAVNKKDKISLYRRESKIT
jgi:hypothetical protein